MKRTLLRCMMVVAVLLVFSCTSELALEGIPQTVVDGEEVEVTFSVSAMSANLSMRDVTDGMGGPGQWQKYIGRGQNIDVLIYAVYEYDDNNDTKEEDRYVLLPQYGQGIDASLSDKKAIKGTTHAGQTVLDVSKTIQQGQSQSITLRLMRNKTYHIAFWAQNGNTTAYDTEDLKNVTVNYDGALNNDEMRDAFCKVEIFSVSVNSPEREVILTRPFAQINVGGVNGEKNYSQTKIVLTGVSNSINVVEDKISDAIDTPVTFDWNSLEEFSKQGENKTLKVDVDNDGDIDGKTKDTSAEVIEEYTYLSMCYALVPASTADSDSENVEIPSYHSSVLSMVEFYVNEGGVENKMFGIPLVPVHRNYRTNILEDPRFNGNPAIIVDLDANYDDGYEGKWREWSVPNTAGN